MLAGMNCAEAVNFGPPDWLPWGHYVGNKYRKDAKAATLSNDALLVNLAKAAPMVQQRLAAVRPLPLSSMTITMRCAVSVFLHTHSRLVPAPVQALPSRAFIVW